MTEDVERDEQRHVEIQTYERAFLAVGIIVLALCAAALGYTTVAMGVHLPGRVAELNPTRVTQTPPFDHPGVWRIGPGRDDVVVVARAWFYTPSEIHIPLGDTATFLVTSADLIHGFFIGQTRVNMMAIPGQVSKLTYVFRKRGEYLLVCHEYCGVGHQTMSGKVVVE